LNGGIRVRVSAVPPAPDHPPYESYAALVASYTGLLATAGLLARLLHRDPEEHSPLDFAILAAANFKAARTISHDKVTSFVREPFVVGEAYDGEDERPAPDGMRRAVGELVTCTRCIGTWTAAGLASVQILAPRFGRLLTWSLAASAANDFLQASFTALTQKSNELEERVEG
jgi:hypothetical protein